MTNLPPRTTHSNRLSDAPSALSTRGEREARLVEGLPALDDFSTVFQPVVRLEDGALFGYEALVRCATPGLRPAGLFAQAAALGCAGRLGRMIREIAVSLCRRTPLFVNVHPSELEEEWLLQPDDPIFTHDDDVYLEISESVPMTHAHVCTSALALARARTGVYLVIDDFGAGWSNLEFIGDLAPKLIKLDRKLIGNLPWNPQKQKIVSAIVRLCQDLGAEVVAEGIETRDELSAVRDTGARYGQGFLLGGPGFPQPRITWPPALGDGKLPPTIPPPGRTGGL